MKTERRGQPGTGGPDTTKPVVEEGNAAKPDPSAPGSSGRENSEIRRSRIERAAYFNAEKRGFKEGGELDDWLEAEKRDAALNPRDS